jgi:osmotically-inducible protein OsmY
MKNIKSLQKYIAIAALAMSLGACSMFEGRETTGEYVDDATITSKVKADILGDPKLKVFQVNVETMQGTVQLSGFVDSWQSKIKAEELARNTKGVKMVKDDLVIR